MERYRTKEYRVDSIRLLSLGEVSHAIGFSSWTIDAWTRASKFPRPLVASPGSPRRWRLRDVEAWIEARRRARNTTPKPRGGLKRGKSLPASGPKQREAVMRKLIRQTAIPNSNVIEQVFSCTAAGEVTCIHCQRTINLGEEYVEVIAYEVEAGTAVSQLHLRYRPECVSKRYQPKGAGND